MKKRTMLLNLILALCLCFALAVPAFATDTSAEQKTMYNPLDKDNMVVTDFSKNSFNDENGNLVQEEIKVYTGKDGWEIKETTQVIFEGNNGIVPFGVGNVTKNITEEVDRFGEKVYRVYIWGKFQYNGSKATVVDASWNTRILSDSVREEQAPYGGSATNIFGTAYIWVEYQLSDDEGSWDGVYKLTCDKNGN